MGLFYHDPRVTNINLLNTIAGNAANYSKRKYDQAVKARELYAKVGYPSTKDYLNMVKFNMLQDFQVTERDIKNANDIFGPDVPALKGKTVRKPPKPVMEQFF